MYDVLKVFVKSIVITSCSLKIHVYTVCTYSCETVYVPAANVTVHHICIFGTRYGDWG